MRFLLKNTIGLATLQNDKILMLCIKPYIVNMSLYSNILRIGSTNLKTAIFNRHLRRISEDSMLLKYTV
jgi:hypothetical protein